MIAIKITEETDVGDERMVDFLLRHLPESQDDLWDRARVALAIVLGNDPHRLNRDEQLTSFVDQYIEEVMLPYALQVGSMQFPLNNLNGQFTMSMMARSFYTDSEKVKEHVFPVEELAQSVFINPTRKWQFFVLTLFLVMLLLKKDKSMREIYSIKRTLFGAWKRV